MGWDPFGTKTAKKIEAASQAAAQAAREKAAADAAAFRFNSAILARNSDIAEEGAYIDEARNRRQGSRFMGEQNSAIAGSGFDTGAGYGTLKESTANELDLDAIIIRRQGQFRAADYTAQSELALMNADAAIKAGEATAKQAVLNGQLQAQQAQNSAISSTIALGAQAVGIYYSDARVKENIERIGTLPTGDGFYAYNYVWEPGVRRMGVMAQEVRERVPEAVSVSSEGILCVDYGKLGLPHGYNLLKAIKKRR